MALKPNAYSRAERQEAETVTRREARAEIEAGRSDESVSMFAAVWREMTTDDDRRYCPMCSNNVEPEALDDGSDARQCPECGHVATDAEFERVD